MEKRDNIKQEGRLISFLLIMLVITSSFASLSINFSLTISGYTLNTPIRINGNFDFAASSSFGNGTEANPWIIDGWEINGFGYGSCIYIGNTTDFFIVQDCYLHNASGAEFFDYSGNGLFLYNVQNGVVRNSSLMNNGNGIHITNSSGVTLFFNSVNNNHMGIALENSFHNSMDSNNISFGYYGMYFSQSNSNTIVNNSFYDNRENINVVYSNDCTIANNSVTKGEQGLSFIEANTNTINNNTISLQSKYGIDISGCLENEYFNNSMYECGFYINGFDIESYSSHKIDQTNKVNDKPVYYLTHQSNINITSNAGQVIIIDSNNISIIGNNYSNTSVGIHVAYSSNVLVKDNAINNNYIGIEIASSTFNISIFNNSILASGFRGILLSGANHSVDNNKLFFNYWGIYIVGVDNRITNNEIVRNTWGITCSFSAHRNAIENNIISESWGMGIYIDSSDSNEIINNTISKGFGSGIYIELLAKNNLIINNNITSNERGIYISSGTDNHIYHNNFINNSINAKDEGDTIWDSGYPLGGNYWDDYIGDDFFRGPGQNLSGSDGIGDSNYTHPDGKNRDRYPQIYPMYFKDYINPNSTIHKRYFYWHRLSPLVINVTAYDIGKGLANVSLWYRFSEDNVSWGVWKIFERDYSYPWTWDFNFPEMDGYYEFYSKATDIAANDEMVPTNTDIQCAFDSTAPIADAGPSILILNHEIISFNGFNSTDNLAIVNYTWTFYYNNTFVTLYGISPVFQFDTPNNYTITLTIRDAAGNWDNDTMTVSVNQEVSQINLVIITAIFIIIAFTGLIFYYKVRKKQSSNE